jgi:hypothetical protein
MIASIRKIVVVVVGAVETVEMCFFRPYMAKNQRPKIVEIVLIKS